MKTTKRWLSLASLMAGIYLGGIYGCGVTEIDVDADVDAPLSIQCGNALLDKGEECDFDILAGEAEYKGPCDEHCELLQCGDGHLDNGEACDDGNREDDDGCQSDCQKETKI